MSESRTGRVMESTFNTALAQAMEQVFPDSGVNFLGETLGLLEGGRRADVLVVSDGISAMRPVAVEVEYDTPSANPMGDAIQRLGQELRDGSVITSALGVLPPKDADHWEDHNKIVEHLLGGAKLRYAVIENPHTHKRWPSKGWTEGTVSSLAALAVAVSVPPEHITAIAEKASDAVHSIAAKLNSGLSQEAKEMLAEAVGRPSGMDSLNVAGVVWLNAFLFQDRIAAVHSHVPTRAKAIGRQRQPLPSDVAAAWEMVTQVDYRSIYTPALRALNVVHDEGGTQVAADALQEASQIAEKVQVGAPDLFHIGGELFPRLLSDRKQAAAYYTRPEVAEFMAHLTVSDEWTPPRFTLANEPTSDTEKPPLRIGDFACGTGTLIRAGYRRVRMLLAAKGWDSEDLSSLHKRMMEDGFCGVDISPIAAHLTAAGLSNMDPATTYERTNIGVVQVCGTDGLTGSLEYLKTNVLGDLFGLQASVTGMDPSPDEQTETPIGLRAPDGEFDLVLMNPPYSRTRGGQPAFDVAGATAAQRDKAQRRASGLLRGTCANMRAGLASAFCELARRKLKVGGRLGIVLPMTTAAADTWTGVREMLEKEFDDLVLVSFAAGSAGGDDSMSADTHMGEMLVFGTKRAKSQDTEADFLSVTLNSRFRSVADAAEIGHAVQHSLSNRGEKSQGIVYIGDDQIGQWDVWRAASGVPWSAIGAAGTSLIYLAETLIRYGKLVPLRSHNSVAQISMTTINNLFMIGSSHDSIGHLHGNDPRGAFEFHRIEDSQIRRDESLWATSAKKQTNITMSPTHYGTPSGNGNEEKMRVEMSTLFYQRNMRWTSQAVLAAVTEREVMGGPAWTALIHKDPAVRFGFAIWANSSLGMAVHWSRSQRQQQGRSRGQIGAIRSMPCPDFEYPDLRNAAERLMAEQPDLLQSALKPANQAAQDTGRKRIDAAFARMLNIDVQVLRDIATEWCHEPSVAKQTSRTRS